MHITKHNKITIKTNNPLFLIQSDQKKERIQRSVIEELNQYIKYHGSILDAVTTLIENIENKKIDLPLSLKNKVFAFSYLTALYSNKMIDKIGSKAKIFDHMRSIFSDIRKEYFLPLLLEENFEICSFEVLRTETGIQLGEIEISHLGLSYFKQYKGLRHTRKANTEIYSNTQVDKLNINGLCFGLSYCYMTYFVNKSETDFLLQLGVMNHIHNNCNINYFFEHELFKEVFHAQNYMFNSFCLKNELIFVEKLGAASHVYLNLHLDGLVKNIFAFILEMKKNGILEAICLLSDIFHAMSFVLEIKESGLIKFKFYDPNTAKGPLVKYISDLKSGNIENTKAMIKEVIESTKYLKSIGSNHFKENIFICFPSEASQKSIARTKICYTDSFDLSVVDISSLKSLLIFSVTHGFVDLVKKIFDRGEIELADTRNQNSVSLLMIASSLGNKILVSFLIKRVTNINEVNLMDGRTALHLATLNGHNDIVKMLLDNGADPNILDQSGRTAFQIASQKGHYSIAEIINKHLIDELIVV